LWFIVCICTDGFFHKELFPSTISKMAIQISKFQFIFLNNAQLNRSPGTLPQHARMSPPGSSCNNAVRISVGAKSECLLLGTGELVVFLFSCLDLN
jgi:hypothetical protein